MQRRVAGLLLLWLFVASCVACVTDDDCGGADQPGVCVGSICQCGIGYSGNTLVDPTACSLTCSPAPVPDSIAFLTEPVLDLSASGGNLVLNVLLDPYLKQNPSTVAFRHPLNGSSCDAMPAQLGNGVWSQAVEDASGQCDTRYIFTSNFANQVSQNCWEVLPPSTESGPQFSIDFQSYRTQLEVIQTGLAPFGQAASKRDARAETSITRELRRDYTISVATQFRPSSNPFTVIAGGALAYRLVIIDYDVTNNIIRATVETETAITAKVANVQFELALSTGTSAVVSGPTTGAACDASSRAGFCSQFHVIEFSDDPCEVSNAEMVLSAEFQCADGSNATTCGFTNLPVDSRYTLPNLFLTYDSCPRVVEYGVDGAASFLRLHEDVARGVPVSAPALQGTTLYGRCSIEPSANGVFQSVTLTALAVKQVASPANLDLGDQLTSTFMTLISPATSTNPSNPIWDFDLEIDPAFFALTETYFLEATLELTFANTGPLTRRIRMLLPKARSETALVHFSSLRDGDVPEPSEEGIASSTFKTRAAEESSVQEPEEEAPASGAAAIGVIAGVVAGVVVAAAVALVVVVVVVRKRRKKRQEENHDVMVNGPNISSSESVGNSANSGESTDALV